MGARPMCFEKTGGLPLKGSGVEDVGHGGFSQLGFGGSSGRWRVLPSFEDLNGEAGQRREWVKSLFRQVGLWRWKLGGNDWASRGGFP